MTVSIGEKERANDMDITDEKEQISENDINEENQSIQERNNIITKEDISTPEKLKNLLNELNSEIKEIFDIIKVIDSGSESIVYEAIYKPKLKTIAIKFIIVGREKKRIYNEINILNKCKNQNIVSCFGFKEIKKGELDCIIMEYAKFGNLKRFQKDSLKKEYLSEQLLCYFTSQILKGFWY